MSPVFFDTSGMLALWNHRDQWHAEAQRVYQPLSVGPRRFVSTPLIFWECGNGVSRSAFRETVALMRDIMKRAGDLITPTDAECEEAWRNFRSGDPGTPGIVDHVSFLVMKRLKIRDVFSTDSHFTAAGFNVLIPTNT